MSFAGGVFVALLSFPIIFVISVVISFFTKIIDQILALARLHQFIALYQ